MEGHFRMKFSNWSEIKNIIFIAMVFFSIYLFILLGGYLK